MDRVRTHFKYLDSNIHTQMLIHAEYIHIFILYLSTEYIHVSAEDAEQRPCMQAKRPDQGQGQLNRRAIVEMDGRGSTPQLRSNAASIITTSTLIAA